MTRIEQIKDGYIVHVGNRITLPGFYLNEFDAERAAARYEATANEAARKQREKRHAKNADT